MLVRPAARAGLFAGALALVLTTAPVWAHGITERVSLGPRGGPGNSVSTAAAISAGGRFVAFYSFASNLVPGDTNGFDDVFVRDRQRGTTERVSSGLAGPEQLRQLRSGDLGGRTLRRFRLARQQPVPGDSNKNCHIFVRDRQGHDPARQPRTGRRPGQRRQQRPGNLDGAGNSSPLHRVPPTWCRRSAPPEAPTCSSASWRPEAYPRYQPRADQPPPWKPERAMPLKPSGTVPAGSGSSRSSGRRRAGHRCRHRS